MRHVSEVAYSIYVKGAMDRLRQPCGTSFLIAERERPREGERERERERGTGLGISYLQFRVWAADIYNLQIPSL